ncbi:MAG: peptidoglycan DD-metalloendopeptidase family protein [Clostridia bacterium]|nr:peptidoglycan DD-metalloendopeptidase family protein [Clostridia bacterium]MBR2414120.1 peptidoglycan DD-metalloendopeptidase family protein [Clostridia bacterium]MBR3955223.1 peptidoglycan DD-metalloendopeptidase family protein [Clostridia bacterium]
MMNTNKKYSRFLALFTALIIVFSSFVVLAGASEADLSDEERAEIEDLRNQQAELDDKIADAEAKMDELADDIENEQAYVEQLTLQLDNLTAQIDVLNASIDAYEEEIVVLEGKIGENEAILADIEDDMYSYRKQALDLQQTSEDTYNLLLERLRYMYMTGETTELEALLDSQSLYSFLLRLELINSIAERDDKLINTMQESIEGANEAEGKFREKADEQQKVITELEKDTAAIAAQQNEVISARSKLEDTQSQQQELYHEAMTNIDKLNSDMEGYDTLVDMYYAEREEFDNEIDRLIAEYSASNPTPPSSGDSSSGGSSSGGSYSTDYIHPLSQYSDVYISSGYGGRTDPATGAYKYHYAIDLCRYSGTSNQNVVAAADGTVVTAEWHSSYGYYVLIAHDTGVYTLMAHNNSLLVSEGERVSQGQVVALSGATGYVTGAHVHFEVRVNGEKVNPLNYVSIG